MTEVLFREDSENKLVPFKDLRVGDIFKPIDADIVFLKIPPVMVISMSFKGNAVLLKKRDNDVTGTIAYVHEAQMVTVYDKIEITGYK